MLTTKTIAQPIIQRVIFGLIANHLRYSSLAVNPCGDQTNRCHSSREVASFSP